MGHTNTRGFQLSTALTHWGRVTHICASKLTIFGSDIFRSIFVNEKFCILIEISLKFVPEGPIDNIQSLVQIMAWRQSGDKSLSEPMMVSHSAWNELTHWSLNKMVAILQTIYSSAFFEWNLLYFDAPFTDFCYQGSDWLNVSIDSGNSLGLSRWQATI